MKALSAGSSEETHTVVYALCAIFLVCRGQRKSQENSGVCGIFWRNR